MKPENSKTRLTGKSDSHPSHKRDAHMRPRPHRILVVEDDDQVRECIVAFLVANDFWVKGVAGMHAAMVMLRVYRFDATILDLHLPDSEPHDTMGAITEMKERGAGKIVLITGLVLPATWRVLGDASGADAFVEKAMPEFPDRLLGAIGLDKRHPKSDSQTQRVSNT